jgi:hypothetical protein
MGYYNFIMRLFQAALKTIWLYSLGGGLYICVNAWVHPESLSWQLTHLTPWIREDTFGMLCFITSAIAYFLLQIVRHDHGRDL